MACMDVVANSFASCLGIGSASISKEDYATEDHAIEEKGVGAKATMARVGLQQGDLLSDLVAGLWPFIRVVMNNMIEEKVAPRFKTLPGPLSTMRFVNIDIGYVPMRLDNVLVHERTEQTLQFDLDLDWDGACDIRLKADYLGAFGIKSLKLRGRLSVLMQPLKSAMPIVQALQIAFINPPKITLGFSGLANLVDMNTIRQRIDDILQRVLQKQMVLPSRTLVKLDQGTSYFEIFKHPIGIVRLTMLNGAGFVVEKRSIIHKDDIPDCYVIASLGNAKQQTSTIKDDLNPVWNERMDFLLSDHDQTIHLKVMDEDGGALDPDDFLGNVDVTAGRVLLEGGQATMDLLDEGGKTTQACVTFRVQKIPFTENLRSLSAESSTKGSVNEIRGLLTILVGQATNLPVKKEDVSARVKITYGTQEFQTKLVTFSAGLDSLNPYFDGSFLIPLTTDSLTVDGRLKTIQLDLLNQKESIGSIDVIHERIALATGCTLTESQAVSDAGAALEYSIQVRGVDLDVRSSGVATSLAGDSSRRSAPNSTRTAAAMSSSKRVNVTVCQASGLKSQRFRKFLRKRHDVADPYCVIHYGSDPQPWRTSTQTNSLAPTWSESRSYTFLNPSQTLRIEVWDDNKDRSKRKRKPKDDLLGLARITVGKVLLNQGSLEVELEKEGIPTGIFVTIRCNVYVGTTPELPGPSK